MSARVQGLRREIVACGRAFHARDFCPATSGNISARLDARRILITPTGVSKGALRPADLVVVTTEGRKLSGRRNPTSEMDMHLLVYRLRPDAGAVVHAHPPTATSFACAGLPLAAPIASEFAMTVGKVPLAPYGTPGTRRLAASLSRLVLGHTAILLANHGVVAFGGDIAEARGRMEMVEHFAKVLLGTLKLGRQSVLPARELKRLHAAARRYVARAESGR